MRLHPSLHAMATLAIGCVLLVQPEGLRAQAAIRKALIIGNNNYTAAPLKNAVNDANAIQEALSDLGYQTILSLNTNRATLANAVDTFAKNLNQGDFAVVYYSGHGLQADGQNYLIPTDFVLGDDDPYTLRKRAYPLGEVLQMIQGRGVATTVIILDACRDNPFLSSRSFKRGLGAPVSQVTGTYLAFATAPGSTASDNPTDVHGLFTKILLQYISKPLGLDDLFAVVRRYVIEASHGIQVPWSSSSLISQVSFGSELYTTNTLTSSASFPVSDGDPTRAITATVTRSVSSARVADDADDASARLLISNALALARHNKVDDAVRIMDAAISAAPWSSLPLRILGLLFHLLGRRSEAVGELDRALTIDPADFRALYYRCLVLAPDDAAAAVANCESSLGISPNFASAHLGLSNAWLATGDVENAYREASRSVALLPLSPLAFSLRGRCELQMGKYEDAQRDFEKARILQELSDRQNPTLP